MNLPNAFYDDPAIAVRELEVTAASWDTGMNWGASNAPGIGIGTDNTNLEEQLPNWTLLDQHGNARAAQISQLLGGPGISDPSTSTGQEGTLPDNVVRLVTNPANVNGQPDNDAPIVGLGNATLLDLAVGWTSV